MLLKIRPAACQSGGHTQTTAPDGDDDGDDAGGQYGTGSPQGAFWTQ